MLRRGYNILGHCGTGLEHIVQGVMLINKYNGYIEQKKEKDAY